MKTSIRYVLEYALTYAQEDKELYVCINYNTMRSCNQPLFSFLPRGQILPSSSLLHRVDVELIYEGTKYSCNVCKKGKNSFFISMNDSFVEAESHRLTDGGRLMSLNGSSYTTYLKEEVESYRIVIDNQTCVFSKENDPTLLR